MTDWDKVVNSKAFLNDEDIQEITLNKMDGTQKANVNAVTNFLMQFGYDRADVIKLVWNGDAYYTGYNNFKELAKHLIHKKEYEHYKKLEDLVFDLEMNSNYQQDEWNHNEIFYINEDSLE